MSNSFRLSRLVKLLNAVINIEHTVRWWLIADEYLIASRGEPFEWIESQEAGLNPKMFICEAPCESQTVIQSSSLQSFLF